MIRTLYNGSQGSLMELNAFEKYMLKTGAELVNGSGDLSEGIEERDYALWQYGVGLRFQRNKDIITISAEGKEEDIDRFNKKFSRDAIDFGKYPE